MASSVSYTRFDSVRRRESSVMTRLGWASVPECHPRRGLKRQDSRLPGSRTLAEVPPRVRPTLTLASAQPEHARMDVAVDTNLRGKGDRLVRNRYRTDKHVSIDGYDTRVLLHDSIDRRCGAVLPHKGAVRESRNRTINGFGQRHQRLLVRLVERQADVDSGRPATVPREPSSACARPDRCPKRLARNRLPRCESDRACRGEHAL